MRYFIELSYKGTNYHGWQIQENADSVQAQLNKALATILRQPIETLGSGRTDTGVHATQQFAHFDIENPVADATKLVYRLNAILPFDIAVKQIFLVSDETHARFDAISRSYEYHITTQKSPFLKDLSYFFPNSVDIKLMNEAATKLLGEKDFASFSKVHTDVNNFFCTISRAEWEQKADMLIFHITANRFLRGMVRAIVGTLLEVGLKKITVSDFENIITLKNRNTAGRNAPPEGLFLTEVKYPVGVVNK
jgi:tRNA pseudouridine38-40 synthase